MLASSLYSISRRGSVITSNRLLQLVHNEGRRHVAPRATFATSPDKEVDPTPHGTKVAFEVPKVGSFEKPGSGTNTVFPTPRDDTEEIASVPLLNNSSTHTSTTQTPLENVSNVGKVITASQEDNLPSGAKTTTVSSHTVVDADPNVHEGASLESQDPLGTGEENRGIGNFKTLSEIERDVKSGTKALKERLASSEEEVLGALEHKSGIKIQSWQEFVKTVKPEERFKPEERELNNDEQRGVYVLLGVVGLGWLLGGLASPSKSKSKEAKH